MCISKSKRDKLKAEKPNNCHYCGKINPDTVDHVTPKNKGGDNNIDNLALACKSCNSSKSDYSLEEYRFHCAWLKTCYSEVISSRDARRLRHLDVNFKHLNLNHSFWFEGLKG